MANIVFFGTSKFSAEILKTISDHHKVLLVVTQPDKPVGRKKQITESPVSKEAANLGLDVTKPTKLKESAAQIKALHPELFVVVAYGKIIPKELLDISSKGNINIHGSLLPKYRGASPIHQAIYEGETGTGITIMLMDEEMDHGPILLSESTVIDSNDTFPQVEEKLLNIAKNLIIKAIPAYISGELKPVEQEHEKATFTKILTKLDGQIDWKRTALQIYNQYKAFINWPGIFTHYQGKVLKITICKPSSEKGLEPGIVFEKENRILVTCQEGSLELLEVQLEGKNKTPIRDFIRGHKDFLGSKLE